eukprot:425123-Hanusia_phi.AAC.2
MSRAEGTRREDLSEKASLAHSHVVSARYDVRRGGRVGERGGRCGEEEEEDEEKEEEKSV